MIIFYFLGRWLSTELMNCMNDLIQTGFRIRGLVTDNHSTNVAAFNILLNENIGDKKQYFSLPNSDHRTYIFFDSVHLVRNIRTNLLNGKKFVFPEFNFNVCGLQISSPPGYISWHDLHTIHEKDQKLEANLRKAPKLSYKCLHPGNNKQKTNLALGIFHETTIAACKSYSPERKDMANFLTLILTWWTISNSNNKYDPNFLGNAITKNDGKICFLENFADWLELWSECPNYSLSKQTSKALILTLRSHAMLICELLNEDYEYVLMRRFQSDPIENRFSQYRSMSGGRFLVSLREVKSSEKILICRSLLKIGIDFWKCDVEELDDEEKRKFDEFVFELEAKEIEIMDCSLSEDSTEVSHYIAGYVARKILIKSKCEDCVPLVMNDTDPKSNYLNVLSRGGLIDASHELSHFIASAFAQIDFIDKFILSTSVRKFSTYALEKYAPISLFSCSIHEEQNRKVAIRIVTNTFYNNQQKLVTDSVRKQNVKEFKKRQRTKE